MHKDCHFLISYAVEVATGIYFILLIFLYLKYVKHLNVLGDDGLFSSLLSLTVV